MNLKKSILVAALGLMATTPTWADDVQEPTYMRSSIYAVLVKSQEQLDRLQRQIDETPQNAIVGIAKDLANKNKSYENVTGLPAELFLTLPIPENFNDHNLEMRVIDFDEVRKLVTDDDIKAANPKSGGKKFGNMLKGVASAAMSTDGSGQSAIIGGETVDEPMPAVIQKWFSLNNIAPKMVAKWFDNDGASNWDTNLIQTRFLQNRSEEEKAKIQANPSYGTILSSKQYDLLNNTFVVAINFRFRSNQAIAAEAEQMAQMAGSAFGGLGTLAATAAGAAGSMAAGDGFTVQALTSLYRLNWDDSCIDKMGALMDKGATLDDLIAAGFCTLEPVGKPEKSSAGVRQSVFNDKPISDLVKRAVARSYDSALAKLMEKNEVFRIVSPISEVAPDGTIYAQIGMKEGISKDDEYEILEMQLDKNGRTIYKSVGKAKAIDKKIWDNRFEASDDLADNGKASEEEKAAVALGKTAFAGPKGKDFTGYYLRLKKKK